MPRANLTKTVTAAFLVAALLLLSAAILVHSTRSARTDVATPGKRKGCAVKNAPSGPSGSWSIVYGDSFCDSLSADGTWHATESEEAFTNTNELEVFRANKVAVGAAGLELACTPLGKEIKRTGLPNAKFACGALNGSEGAPRPFEWRSNEGEAMAFECFCRWPRDTGEADPGWWTDDREGNNEYDFFEGDGWDNAREGEYEGRWPAIVQINQSHTTANIEKTLGLFPSEGYNRYTTVFSPEGTHYVAEEYINGKFEWDFGYEASKREWDHLKLSYAIRFPSKGPEEAKNFTSGTRYFDVRSVAVYEDAAHTGDAIANQGIAPGTFVEH